MFDDRYNSRTISLSIPLQVTVSPRYVRLGGTLSARPWWRLHRVAFRPTIHQQAHPTIRHMNEVPGVANTLPFLSFVVCTHSGRLCTGMGPDRERSDHGHGQFTFGAVAASNG